MPGFSVDTKLFRELGELLVGRESTALVELIKNAYDRRSGWFQRRYTGEKGVGRLAAHKLARVIKIGSRRWTGANRDPDGGFPAEEAIDATINWDKIEALDTIDQIEKSDAVTLKASEAKPKIAGTTLTLAPLRKQWSERDREQFIDEVATLTPPEVLISPLKPTITTTEPLFDTLTVRDELYPGGFIVTYAGDLKLAESELPAEPDSASWIIEIDCDKKKRRLRISVMPTRKTQSDFANAEPFILDRKLDKADPAVGFQARLFQMSNAQWPRRYQGVRVYFEGFRVLPYGDARDDWLQLDRDYRSRGHAELGRLRKRATWSLPEGSEKESLAVQGNTAFFRCCAADSLGRGRAGDAGQSRGLRAQRAIRFHH